MFSCRWERIEHAYEPCGRNLGFLAGERLESSSNEPGDNGQLFQGLVGEKVQGKKGREQVGLGGSEFRGSSSHLIRHKLAGGEEGPLFLLSFHKERRPPVQEPL